MTFRTALSADMTRLAITVFSIFAVCTVVRSDEAAKADTPKPGFEPGDIAIGEPIPLPFAAPRTEIAPPPPATPPSDPAEPKSLLTDPHASASVSASPARGTGWIGLQVAESTEPGRWAISEVARGGPAATAGITVGDEVRAIDGVLLRSAEDVAQALTSLAAGQRVSLALARDGQPLDISLLAVERPVALSSRTWQSSPEPSPDAEPPTPAAAPSFETSPPPFASAPRFTAPAPDAAGLPPAPDPDPMPRTSPSPFTAPERAAEPPAVAAPERFGAPPTIPATLPAPASSPSGRTALGVRTLPIDPELQSRFKLPDPNGAYVIGVVQDLPASKAGVPPGSVIVALDNRPVRSPDELTRLVTTGPVGRPVSLQYVLPGGASHRAEVVLQSLERPLEAALVGPDPMSATPAPTLQPGLPSTTSRRPVSGGVSGSARADEARGIKVEIEKLRARLEQLERRLETIAR